MPRPDLTPDQQADADILRQHLMAAVAADIDGLAQLLATRADRDLFGATAFQVRDLVLAIGAKAPQAAADLRKKLSVPDYGAGVETLWKSRLPHTPGGWQRPTTRTHGGRKRRGFERPSRGEHRAAP